MWEAQTCGEVNARPSTMEREAPKALPAHADLRSEIKALVDILPEASLAKAKKAVQRFAARGKRAGV